MSSRVVVRTGLAAMAAALWLAAWGQPAAQAREQERAAVAAGLARRVRAMNAEALQLAAGEPLTGPGRAEVSARLRERAAALRS